VAWILVCDAKKKYLLSRNQREINGEFSHFFCPRSMSLKKTRLLVLLLIWLRSAKSDVAECGVDIGMAKFFDAKNGISFREIKEG